jgi:hypothetical protein
MMDSRAERAEEVPGQHQYNSGHNQTHLDRAIGQSGKKTGPIADLTSSSRKAPIKKPPNKSHPAPIQI